ncbi:NAD(P)-dependent oxidoreductase [Tenacibaculum sp. UWU-22]|uniref:SDR family oxidoreductase n=1 Tax=Tenacibaculum sp. UWU-22 TaxID=3234187 RepID=UPI0034DB6F90
MKKVVITGSNGLLGQSLVNLLLKEKESYKVYGFSRGENKSGREDFSYISIDITNKTQLHKKLTECNADVIINTAAMANVDECEKNKQQCDNINVTAVKYLVDFCEETNAHLVHISTDFIFDGTKGYYAETDMPNPINYYGLSKLKSEKIIEKSKIKYTILRTILVYGNVHHMPRKNIVLWVKQSLKERKEVTIVNDQYRMPTYVENLALACKIAIDKTHTGIYNISSNTLLSIYEIALQIAEVFNLDKSLIKPISTTTLNQIAPRPVKTGFDLSKTQNVLQLHVQSFKEDLEIFKTTML